MVDLKCRVLPGKPSPWVVLFCGTYLTEVNLKNQEIFLELCIVAHICNPSTWEAKAGGLLQVIIAWAIVRLYFKQQ